MIKTTTLAAVDGMCKSASWTEVFSNKDGRFLFSMKTEDFDAVFEAGMLDGIIKIAEEGGELPVGCIPF